MWCTKLAGPLRITRTSYLQRCCASTKAKSKESHIVPPAETEDIQSTLPGYNENQINKPRTTSTYYPNVVQQTPNRSTPWVRNQMPREEVFRGARFEQTDLSLQPTPLAAVDLIAKQPVIQVERRIATCDGGGGPLGHPKVYINLDQEGPATCNYCGLRFEQLHHH